jgi:uncharacterized protein (DUF433 family)
MSLTISSEPTPLIVNSDGAVLIGKTRVTLDSVIEMFETGATAEDITEQFSSLDLADVYATISYYLKHQDEVLQYLKTREQLNQQLLVGTAFTLGTAKYYHHIWGRRSKQRGF